MAKKLRSRNYIVSWHWRDDDPYLLKTDEISATTAPRAIAKVKRELGKEYASVNTEMVVIGVVDKDQ